MAAAVEHALKTGYRHIDGALCYGNEKEVGAGLKAGFDSGIKREDVFVTTKLWSTHHRDVEKAIDTSLADLGLDYVDLYLIHWPVAMNQNGNHPLFPKLPDGSRDIDHDRKHTDTWKDMEKLLETGKTKAVGVCNYSAKYLQELLDIATTKPTVNQIENHPLLPQEEILELAKANGILVTAYSPLGSADSPLLKDEDVVRIAEKHSVEPANVLIGYGRKSSHPCSLASFRCVVANETITQSPEVMPSFRSL